ncbi:LuxR C-terminal-related transcriptional regulator [Amycolatopsis coloradensis]|uniref:LuxR C-terminal-related transcriptional regulator n=1 Tax=Amycolatopsis coloradensis TaxID=76021 RepID=UPI00142DC656|nr:LuxR C-terminal-related transcriptional regulator [Amycolatopsis coloradensis]
MTTTGAHVLTMPTRGQGRNQDDDTTELVEHALLCVRQAVDSLALATRLLSDRGGSGADTGGPRAPAEPSRGDRSGDLRLSNQENRVLTLVTAGLSNRKIAELLDISDKTAKNYVHTVLLKLGAATRTEAAFTALCERLVDPEECRRARTLASGAATPPHLLVPPTH